jgi:hypothetical protein
MPMSDLELNIHISYLKDQGDALMPMRFATMTQDQYKKYDALWDKRRNLCLLRWSKVPTKLVNWCNNRAMATNIAMKNWRKNNMRPSVAVKT